MKVYLTRESVCAGDDGDAPHAEEIAVVDGAGIRDIIAIIAKSGYLASIIGGEATWSASSRILLAVIAQQWPEPRMLSQFPTRLESLDVRGGILHIHFNYHAQQSPDTVYDVLQRIQQS